MSLNYVVQPGGTLRGTLRVPGDKSISHRSVLLGSLAHGETRVSGFLEGEDTRATAAAMRAMGVIIEADGAGALRIVGRGLRGLSAPNTSLDLGNSGTGMRLLAGVLAGQPFRSRVFGDASLNSRPMRRIADPLRRMGAQFETTDTGTPPLDIGPAEALSGIRYEMPVASAQVKSCLLLAGLYADGETVVVEPGLCRDHTERMLNGFGYPVTREGNCVSLRGGGQLQAGEVEVPADISSAAFFLVAASIAPGSDLTLTGVGVNPTRDGVIQILKLMGADIELLNRCERSYEPVADIRVRYAPLRGIRIPEELVANAIDEFPALFVAAACATGETRLTGAGELRVKESDRIGAMATGLQALGADAEATPDGMVVRGRELRGGTVRSFGDHRIAMALSMAGLKAAGRVIVEDCANVQTSFPSFAATSAAVGVRIAEQRS
ncbi:MAG: 3-phosphoshikimate 1-carboxyvinyltransferase [Pseudomonadota bacterium]